MFGLEFLLGWSFLGWSLAAASSSSLQALPVEAWATEPWKPPPGVVAWVADHWPEDGSVRHRSEHLHDLLTSPGGLGVRETPGASYAASEVARRAQADCVGFAMLYAGVARAMGLRARFAIEDRGPVGRRGGLKIMESHLAVVFEIDRQTWVVDFAGVRRAHASLRSIDDRAAAAILWSNFGARSLMADRCELALAWTRRAAEAAPRLASVRGNLATVERHCGVGASPLREAVATPEVVAQRSTQ